MPSVYTDIDYTTYIRWYQATLCKSRIYCLTGDHCFVSFVFATYLFDSIVCTVILNISYSPQILRSIVHLYDKAKAVLLV